MIWEEVRDVLLRRNASILSHTTEKDEEAEWNRGTMVYLYCPQHAKLGAYWLFLRVLLLLHGHGNLKPPMESQSMLNRVQCQVNMVKKNLHRLSKNYTQA